jgi:hypothetical protein
VSADGHFFSFLQLYKNLFEIYDIAVKIPFTFFHNTNLYQCVIKSISMDVYLFMLVFTVIDKNAEYYSTAGISVSI